MYTSKYLDRKALANSAGPDQKPGGFWSGPALFATQPAV